MLALLGSMAHITSLYMDAQYAQFTRTVMKIKEANFQTVTREKPPENIMVTNIAIM